jgi:hypothetical protein
MVNPSDGADLSIVLWSWGFEIGERGRIYAHVSLTGVIIGSFILILSITGIKKGTVTSD